jgi:hypothetical protein
LELFLAPIRYISPGSLGHFDVEILADRSVKFADSPKLLWDGRCYWHHFIDIRRFKGVPAAESGAPTKEGEGRYYASSPAHQFVSSGLEQYIANCRRDSGVGGDAEGIC